MAEDTANSSSASRQDTPSAEEIAEVIQELESYRDRLVEDFMTAAKKAKLPKSMVKAQLENHPEIRKIDTSLEQLRAQQPS